MDRDSFNMLVGAAIGFVLATIIVAIMARSINQDRVVECAQSGATEIRNVKIKCEIVKDADHVK